MGRSRPLSLPVNLRTKWGTISPTKPRSPAKLTAAPASRAANTRKSMRYRPTRRPTPWAVSSPSVTTSSSLHRVNSTASASEISPAAGSRRM